MATIANLVVKLSANTTAFDKGMKRGKKQLSGFGKQSSQMSAKFKVAAAAIVAAAVAAAIAIGRMTLRTLDALDETAKFASRIGVATAELQKLQFAAELSGVGASTLNMALQRMTRRIAEAAAGTGEAKDAIKELGLDAKQLAAAGPERAFSMIADAMQKVESQSDKVRLAFKLFDSEGVALVNTLALGSEGLREAGDEAERLGIAISELDAKNIQEGADAITRMGKAWEGVKNVLAIALLPFVERFSEEIQPVLNGLRVFLGAFKGDTAIAEFEAGLAASADRAIAASNAIDQATKSADALAAATKKAADEKERLEKVAGFKKLGESITDALRKPAEIFKDTIKELRMLFEGGFIDNQTARRAIEKAKADLAVATGATAAGVNFLTPIRAGTPGAATRGSVEALAAIAANNRIGTATINQTLMRQNGIITDGNAILEEVARNTGELFLEDAPL